MKFIGRTDAEAEAPIIWPSDVKSWLTGKDPDDGKNWRQEEKGRTVHEMDGITNSKDMSFRKPWEFVMDRETGMLRSMRSQRIGHCCSRVFWETNSLRRAMQTVECGLLHRRPKAESPLSLGPRPVFLKTLYNLSVRAKPTSPNSLKLVWTKEEKDTIKA